MIFVHPGQLDGSVSESETRTVCFQFFYRLYNYKNATNLVLTMEQDIEGAETPLPLPVAVQQSLQVRFKMMLIPHHRLQPMITQQMLQPFLFDLG